jgi:hypothetical protein
MELRLSVVDIGYERWHVFWTCTRYWVVLTGVRQTCDIFRKGKTEYQVGAWFCFWFCPSTVRVVPCWWRRFLCRPFALRTEMLHYQRLWGVYTVSLARQTAVFPCPSCPSGITSTSVRKTCSRWTYALCPPHLQLYLFIFEANMTDIKRCVK